MGGFKIEGPLYIDVITGSMDTSVTVEVSDGNEGKITLLVLYWLFLAHEKDLWSSSKRQ